MNKVRIGSLVLYPHNLVLNSKKLISHPFMADGFFIEFKNGLHPFLMILPFQGNFLISHI
jgi:hypothetical protein